MSDEGRESLLVGSPITAVPLGKTRSKKARSFPAAGGPPGKRAEVITYTFLYKSIISISWHKSLR